MVAAAGCATTYESKYLGSAYARLDYKPPFGADVELSLKVDPLGFFDSVIGPGAIKTIGDVMLEPLPGIVGSASAVWVAPATINLAALLQLDPWGLASSFIGAVEELDPVAVP